MPGQLGRLSPDRLFVFLVYFRWTPDPVIVIIMHNKDYIRVLLYSYYTAITGWGGPPEVYF